MEDKKEVALNQYEDVIKPHLNRDTVHNIYARWANSYDQVIFHEYQYGCLFDHNIDLQGPNF